MLVADDSTDGAEMLATLLGSLGCEVQTVSDGAAAVRESERFRPDLVLLDIGMPGMDGYEACRPIRRATWGTEMVMVAITGWGQEEDRRRSAEAGFDLHLVKPVDPALLVPLVRRTPATRPIGAWVTPPSLRKDDRAMFTNGHHPKLTVATQFQPFSSRAHQRLAPA